MVKNVRCYLMCLFIVMFFGCGEYNNKGQSSAESLQSDPMPEGKQLSKEELAVILEKKVWILESYGSPNSMQTVTVPEASEITAIFDFASASISGYGGCNWYKCRFDISGDTLSIKPGMFTRRACISADLSKQEYEYFNALAAAERYRIEKNLLRIFYAGTNVLNFKKSDDERLFEHVRASIPF